MQVNYAKEDGTTQGEAGAKPSGTGDRFPESWQGEAAKLDLHKLLDEDDSRDQADQEARKMKLGALMDRMNIKGRTDEETQNLKDMFKSDPK